MYYPGQSSFPVGGLFGVAEGTGVLGGPDAAVSGQAAGAAGVPGYLNSVGVVPRLPRAGAGTPATEEGSYI